MDYPDMNHGFKQFTSHGWGCGYVLVPPEHACYLSSSNEIYSKLIDIRPGFFGQFITFTDFARYLVEEPELQEYWAIGFGTKHGFSTPEDDMNYVLRQTQHLFVLLELIDYASRS